MTRYLTTVVLLINVCSVAVVAGNAPRLPSRDPVVVVPLLQSFTAGKAYKDVVAILGKADLDVGGASPSATFRLSDGSSIHVATRNPDPFLVRDIVLYSAGKNQRRVLFHSP